MGDHRDMKLLYNIDFEVASLGYLLVVNIFLRLQYTRTEINREFQRLALSTLIADALDVATAITISYGAVVPNWFNMLFNTTYAGMIVIVGYCFMRYVSAYVYAGRETPVMLCNDILFAVCLCTVLANMLTGHIFYFDEQGSYIHGPLYLLVYFIPYYYMLFAAGVLLRNRAKFRIRQQISIFVFLVLSMLGIGAQMLFFSDVLLSVFSITVGELVLMFTLETPDYQRLIETMEELDNLQKNLKHEVRRQTQKADRLARQAMQTLGMTIDAKDTYTKGHSVRVAEYAREMIRRNGGSEEEQERIYEMGLLHDIGKIGVSDAVINKSSSLTDQEYAQIKQHPVIGADILKSMAEEIPGIEVGARWHHERYDGGGYPDGLIGEEIPKEARIIGVADAYDAMTSRRSYRDALPQAVVRSELVKGMGKQFDPVYAKLMIQMMDEDVHYDLREK